MNAVDLGSLANHLVAAREARRVVAVTSFTTGNPALSRLDLTGLDVLVTLQYAQPEQASLFHEARRVGSLADLRRRADAMALWGTFEVALVDPFHSYRSSWECLEIGLDLLQPGGVMLVHDCLPPLDLIGEEYVVGPWCGVTFAAFADLCASRGLNWCTVNADFGIGVVVAGSASARPADQAAAALPEGAPGRTVARYADDPFAVMRAVSTERLDEAVARLVAGRPVGDLVEEFTGWDAALSEATPDVPLELQVAALQRDLDRHNAALARLSGARGQLSALSRSVPAALRARAARARRRLSAAG